MTSDSSSIELELIASERWAQALPKCVADHLATVDATVFAVEDDASDTAQFSARYGFELDDCANTIIVRYKKASAEHYAAVVTLGSRKLDVNGLLKAALGAQRLSFAKREDAVERSGMEFGGITAFGLPADWPVCVDAAVLARDRVVMGAGVRAAKLLLRPDVLRGLPNVRIVDIAVPAADPIQE